MSYGLPDARWGRLAAIVAGLVLIVAWAAASGGQEGSSKDGSTGPPAACLADMREAAGEPDSAAAQPILVRSLTSCETAGQWLAALRRYPAAMGLKDASFVGEIDLDAACPSAPGSRVCTSR